MSGPSPAAMDAAHAVTILEREIARLRGLRWREAGLVAGSLALLLTALALVLFLTPHPLAPALVLAVLSLANVWVLLARLSAADRRIAAAGEQLALARRDAAG